MSNKLKIINFWNLISEHKIVIPIIQRDYAQGRDGDEIKKKRDNFLKALHEALTTDKRQTLDFIYGQLNEKTFSPLDGQQRLTTLYLLHWYIASKENKLQGDVQSTLSKFSYETRISSREFCQELVLKGCELKPDEKVSTTIKTRCNWWVLSWEKDPTIKAMLTMLDDIKVLFKEDNLWEQLISDKISFINFPITDFGLSDDLYVKMNARGKTLTDFENWKAEFEKQISIKEWEVAKKGTETFACQIDTTWTDHFWKYKDADNKIDDRMLSFIRAIQLTSVVLNPEEKEVEKITLENFHYYDPSKYNKADYDSLCESLNLWKKVAPDSCFQLKWVDIGEEKAIFKRIILGKATYPERVIFYAATKALEVGMSFDSQFAKEWMRVIRNIVENSTIDSFETYRGAINLVKEISAGCKDIYQWLQDSKKSINSFFASEQMKEEIIKAKLIFHNPEWKEQLFDCEDTDFSHGRINFALRCIGYDGNPENFDADKLIKVTDILEKYFSKINEQPIKHQMWRAFLTTGDNKFYHHWSSWSYIKACSKYKMPNNLIGEKNSESLQYFCNNESCRVYAIELIDKLLETEHNSDLDLYIDSYICPEDMPEWKKLFIKEKNQEILNLAHCTKGFLCVNEEEGKCWLIDGRRPSNEDRYKAIPLETNA